MLGEGPRIGPRDRSRISWAVLAMVALVALAAPVSSKGLSASSGCIHSGGEVRIQSVLHGRGARAVLCQHAKFVLSHTIRFTAPEQRIYTNAFPRDDARATLTLTNSMDSTAVSGADQTGVQLTNVIVDGGNGQPNQPALRDGPQPLVLMGGTGSDQRLEWVTSRDPRGWSTFQCFQPGPRAVVRHNTFGPGQPIGDHWPYEDTTPVSDGISFGCNNDKVSDNRIINVNDVGIALFSPIGSVIEHNTIIASDRAVGAGIALVDPVPNFGNFTGVMVRDNIIDAAGAPIIQGLAAGPRVTCFVAPGAHTFIEDGQAGQPDSIYGGTIRGNTLRGEHMGYGYVVSGVRDFTIADNRDNSVHSGTPWPETFPDPGGSWTCPPPDPPAGFQFDAEHTATTNLQAEFQSARVEGSGNLCHPGDLNDDGKIDHADLTRLEQMVADPDHAELCRGDLDRDGVIDQHDVAILTQMLGAG